VGARLRYPRNVGPRNAHTRLVLVGVGVLTAIVFYATFSWWGAALKRGQYSVYFSPGLVSGLIMLAVLRLVERQNRLTFGARFRECASVVVMGIAPGLLAATSGHQAPWEIPPTSGARINVTLIAGVLGLVLAARLAGRLAEARVAADPRRLWRFAFGACAAAACLVASVPTQLQGERRFLSSRTAVGELPSAPWVAEVPNEQRSTVSLGGVRLTRGGNCSLYVEAPNSCSQLVPFAHSSAQTCDAVRLYEDSDGWWLDVDGNPLKQVTRSGFVAFDARWGNARRAIALRVAGALLGLVIAAWSLTSAVRARRRGRKVAAGLDATHRGQGWIAPDDDRPPVHLPSAAAEEAGPVVLTDAPSPPGTYREGGTTPATVTHVPGTRDAAIAGARDEERGNLAYALAAVVLLTTPLVCALFRGIAP
jgi:hypothetical protein